MALNTPTITPGTTEFNPDAAAVVNAAVAVTGTAAEFTSANPVLAAGQRGRETDTGKEKVGDGSTAWTSLAYTTESGETIATKLAGQLGDDGAVEVENGEIVTKPILPAPSGTGFWHEDSGTTIKSAAETLALLAAAAATVTVTGSGEKDIAVTAATTSLVIAPTGGNMTLDQVTGLAYAWQAIGVTLKQDSSDRTLALAVGTNAALRAGDAIDMPSGSGALAQAMLVAVPDGSGALVPTFFAVP